jgi:hypothetical protein
VRAWRAWLAVAVLAAAGATAWVAWPRPAATPQARQYLSVSACLLTGSGGVLPGTPGAPVWADMEKASLATRVMISYLPETGPGVGVLLNTLAERRCGVIITTSAAPAQVTAAAKASPHQHYLVVASGSAAGPASPASAAVANVVVVSAVAAPARIDQAFRDVAAQNSQSAS